MADELNPIEQRLILTIEEHLKGALKASSELAAVTKSAQDCSRALGKYDKAVQSSTTNLQGFKKTLMHVTATASILTGTLRKAALGFAGLTAGLTKAWHTVISGNKALLTYTLTSSNAKVSVDKLRAVVDKSRKSFDSSAYSYRDAAAALSEYQSQSLEAASSLDLLPGLKQQIADALQTISQNYGQQEADDLWNNVIGSLGDRPIELQKLLNIASQGGDDMRENMVKFVRSIDPADKKLHATVGRWANLMQNMGDNSPATRSIKTWGAFWSKLNTMLEDFSTNIVTMLGTKIEPIFQQLEGYFPKIEQGLSSALDWVTNHLDSIVSGFKGVITWIAKAVQWFAQLGTGGKSIVGLTAAIALLPGLGQTILAFIGKIASLVKHFGGIGASAKKAFGIIPTVIKGAFNIIGKAPKFIVSMPGMLMRSAAAAGKFALSLNPIGVIITSLASAAYQFYTWWSKGAENTWGGKLAEWLIDANGKMDELNKKSGEIQRTWFGFGAKVVEVDYRVKDKEDFDRKKKAGSLLPDEQDFESFHKKRSKLRGEINKEIQENAVKSNESINDSAKTEALDRARKSMEEITEQTEQLAAKARSIKYEGLDDAARFAMMWAQAGDSVEQKISSTNIAFDSLKISTDAATKSAESLSTIMETSGFGQFNEMGKASREMANSLTPMIGEMKRYAELQLETAQQALATTKDASEGRRLLGQIAEAQSKIAEAGKLILTRDQLLTQEYEKRRRLQKLDTEADEAKLRIAQATYGAAGLSAKAQMNVVNSLEKQKQFLKAQYSLLMKEVEAGTGGIATLQKAKELRNEILNITGDQVDMLKELRDGYLDAVQAQAFGAGKFEKIIITQEKNLRVGLEKGIAKANFLLGTVGEAARMSDVPIARFSAGGYGLETLEGGMMGDQDVKDWQKELTKNMPDAISKAAAQAATDITFESMRHIDASLYRVDKSVTAFDDVVQKSIKAMSRFGAAAGGGATADVLFGEAMRQGAMPPAATPGRGADYPPADYPVPQISYTAPGREMDKDWDKYTDEQKAAWREQRKLEATRAALYQKQHEALISHLENMQRNQAAGLVSGMEGIPQLETIKVEQEKTPETGNVPFLKLLQDEFNISTGRYEDMMDNLRKGTVEGQKSVVESLKKIGVKDETMQFAILEALDSIVYQAGQMPQDAPEIDPYKLFGKEQIPQLNQQQNDLIEKLGAESEEVEAMWKNMSSVFKDLNLTMDDFSGEELRNLLEQYKQGVEDVNQATMAGKKSAEKYAETISQRNTKALENFSVMSGKAFISAMPETIKRIEDSGIKIGQSLQIRPDVIADFHGSQESLNKAYAKIVEAQKAAREGNEELAASYREHALLDLAEGANLKDEDVVSSLENIRNSIEDQVRAIDGAASLLDTVGIGIGEKIYSIAEENFKGAWDYIQDLYQKLPKVEVPDVDTTVKTDITPDPAKIDATVKAGLKAKPDKVEAPVSATPPPPKIEAPVEAPVSATPPPPKIEAPVEVKIDANKVEFEVRVPPIAADLEALNTVTAATSSQLQSVTSNMSQAMSSVGRFTSSMANLAESSVKTGYAIDDTAQRMVKAILVLQKASNGQLLGVQESLQKQVVFNLATPDDPLQSQARFQAEMRSMAASAPLAPQINITKAEDSGATVGGKALKTARRAIASSGGGGGRVTQLFREGFAKMFEAAAIMDDYIDEDEIEREDRPGSTGRRTIPGG